METFTDIGPLIEGSGDTDRPTTLEASAQNEALARLTEIARLLSTKPFRPHPLFKGGHAQTLAAYAWPLRSVLRSARDTTAYFSKSDMISRAPRSYVM